MANVDYNEIGISAKATLDTSDVKKGSEEIDKALRHTVEVFESTGDKATQKFNQVAKSMEGVNAAVQEGAQRFAEIGDSLDFAKSLETSDLLKGKIVGLIGAFEQLGEKGDLIGIENTAKRIKAAVDELADLEKEAVATTEKLDRLRDIFTRYGLQTENNKAPELQVNEEDVQKIIDQRTETDRLEDSLRHLRQQYADGLNAGKTLQDLQSLEGRIVSLQNKLNNLRESERIADAFKRIDETVSTAFPQVPVESVKSFLNTRTEVDRLRDSLDLLAQEWATATESGDSKKALSIERQYANTRAKIDAVTEAERRQAQAAEEAAAKFRMLGGAADEVVSKFQQGSKLEFFTNFSDKFSESFSAADAFKNAGKTIQKTFSIIGTAAKKGAKELYKFGRSVLDNLGSKLTEGIRRVQNLANSFGRILMYRMVRTLIKDIGAAFKTGIDNMYQWSLTADGVFASSMDRLASEAQHVKNALGAALAPVINAMVPIVERLAHAFIDLVNGFNQFVAALTGASSWTKALHTPVKYADAASDSLSKATKKAKEYKNTILSFDELNVLNGVDDDDSGASGAGGADAIDYSKMFENAPVSDFWKKMLALDDWEEFGRETARRLNKWLAEVDKWILTTARPWAMKWSKRIATFLNGFIDELDWNLVGKTIADGMMVIVDAVNQFFDIFDAYNFGRKLSEGIVSWFTTMDWEAVGKYFSNGLNFVIDTATGFFENFVEHASKIGQDLGTAFNAWVENIHWDNLQRGISSGLKSIADVIWGFLDTSSGGWDKFRERFVQIVETVFSSPDLTRIISGIGEFINRLVVLIGDVNWEPIGASVADALASIDWWNLLTTVVESIAEFFSGLMKESFSTDQGRAFLGTVAAVAGLAGAFSLVKSGLGVALTAFTWSIADALKTSIVATLGAEGTVGTTLSTTLGGLGTVALTSLGWIAGIGGLIAEIGIIAYGAVQAIGTGLDYMDAKWAESQSVITLQSALAEKGVQASTEQINQYLNGTIGVTELTGGKFSSFAEMTGAAMSNASGSVETSLTAISEATADTFTTLGESTYDFSEDVNSAIVGFLESASDGSSESMNDMADGMTDAFDKIAGNIETITKSLSGAFNSMSSSISGSMQTMYNSVSTWMARMASNIEQQAKRIQGAFNSVNTAAGSIQSRTVTVPAHAKGGQIEDGLFMANSGEIIGEFSNGKNYVANNEMIVEGIEQGVYNAVSNAIMNNPNQGAGGDVVLMIDSEEIARASIKGQRSIDRRFNPVVKFTG